jgi:YbbR domain-containing protein
VSWNLVTNEWRLKLLALGLAVLMLGAVAFSQNPPTTRSQIVGLSYAVGPDIILINPPSKTTVTYTGLADLIVNVTPSNLTATVDATHATPGAAVKLNVAARSTMLGVNVQNPAPIAVDIDSRKVKELAVQVAARADTGWSISKAVATPSTVHFDGPLSWETNLVATVTFPGVVNVGTRESPNQPILLKNSGGLLDLSAARTVPAASLDFNAATIHIEATPGSTSSTVALVDAPPSQPPPAGYRVTGITITPNTVVITGDAAIVGRIQRITLPSVDLSTRTSDFTFQITIPYPDGTAGNVATARVTYTIARNPNTSP